MEGVCGKYGCRQLITWLTACMFMVTMCFDCEVPHFPVVMLHHCCKLASLEKTIARELWSSGGEEEGRENNHCQLLLGSGNHVRARSWRLAWKRLEVTAKSPWRSRDFTYRVRAEFHESQAFRQSLPRDYENMPSLVWTVSHLLLLIYICYRFLLCDSAPHPAPPHFNHCQ